jgi:cytoskeleton protein RodZ
MQARLDLQLSREDVAGKLHLSSRQIEALEENDYRSLPGPTYVRGYLKSYALLLGISPDAILDVHARMIAKPVQQDFSTIAPQKEMTSRHHQVRFTTWLLVVIVIGLAVAWWAGRDVRPPSVLPASSPGGEAQDGSAKSESETVVQKSEVATAERQPEAPVAPHVTAPAPVTPPVAKPTVSPPVAAPPAVASAKPPAPAIPALPPGPRARLVVNAEQDTWMDVRDARQVKLLYETVPAGRTVTLEGVAPISVFLGNAGGARLEYNGKAVDVTPYKRGMFARFTLGEEEAPVAPKF